MNELTMNLKTDSKVPLYEQIYNYIKSDIQNGRISYGEKLPSTRALARHLEISRSTAELAYEQLLSEGYIRSVLQKHQQKKKKNRSHDTVMTLRQTEWI